MKPVIPAERERGAFGAGGVGMSRVVTVCGLGGRLTVVCVDEMRRLRGVVDELDLADLPHLGAFVTELLQHTHAHAHTGVTLGFPTACRAQPGLR